MLCGVFWQSEPDPNMYGNKSVFANLTIVGVYRMKMLSLEEHRMRLENIHYAEEKVASYHRRIRFNNYIPGQVAYHMGDIPNRVEVAPTEYDYNTLKRLHEDGYEWIQWHTDCIDWARRHGGDAFMNGDWEGTQKFIDLAHSFGHKMIPYISPTYFPTYDPEFREEFTKIKRACFCSTFYVCAGDLGNPAWREYNYRKTFEVMDRLNFDGIYADFGYDKFLLRSAWEWDHYGNDIHGLYAPLEYDPEVEDYLSMIYSELKSRGLLYKLHLGAFQPIPVKDKVYDYLWVGEAGKDIKDILLCKDHAPYMVPAFDRNSAPLPDPELAYTLTIPFGQFPILYYGRPYATKERYTLKDFHYFIDPPERDLAHEYYLEHPNGPYVYSEWSAIPDDPMEYDRSTNYLKLYKPMVTDGSVLRMEIRSAAFILSPIPQDVYISMFTNEEQYLVVGNVSGSPYTLRLDGNWKDRQTGAVGTQFTAENNRLLFLIKE